MKNQATASSLASRAVQRRGEARGQRERVQTYDEVDTFNLFFCYIERDIIMNFSLI